MEIFTLLETLEECLERAKKVPFTQKVIIDTDEVFMSDDRVRLIAQDIIDHHNTKTHNKHVY